ncbi:MAG: hypothetical protein EOP87_01590 [Verrucomicrobiaceae bacterium]|nr:MAG: hypothetical protein EOP87_01590 [Verrucomicrobiaceae bacterium]
MPSTAVGSPVGFPSIPRVRGRPPRSPFARAASAFTVVFAWPALRFRSRFAFTTASCSAG